MNYPELDLSILRAILSNKKLALEFVHNADPKIFHSDLWRFAKAVLEHTKIYKTPPTKRILLEQYKKNEALSKYIGDTYDKVESCKYDEKEYAFDLEKLKSKYSEKLIVELKDALSNADGKIDVKKSIGEIQGALNGIKSVSGGKSYKDGTLKDYSKDFKTIYEAKLKDPGWGAGTKTGYNFIDEPTAGLKNSELFLVGGTTAAGKSMFMMNVALNMFLGGNDIDTTGEFRPGNDVVFYSLEMNHADLCSRLIAALARVPQKSIRDAKLTDEEKKRVGKAFAFLNKYPHQFQVIDTPRLTPDGLELSLNSEIAKTGKKPAICCVDYLNIMKTDSGNKETQDWLLQSELSAMLHEIARSFEIIMLSAIQLNPKSGDKEGGGEFGIKSLRRSTSIADHCDLLAIIQTRRNERSFPDFAISLAKNRRGELTDAKLQKNFECCLILDQKLGDGSVPGDIEDISGLV